MESPPPPPSLLDEVFSQAGPFAGQIGVGAVAGYAAGAALRTVGKAAAVGVGMLFCGLQAASYSGFVDVDWARVERAVAGVLDADGDGKLTARDAQLAASKLQTVLEFGLPGGTGFASGLTLALGGRLGRLAVLGTAACALPTLATAHAYSASPNFRQQLEEVAPSVAGALHAALEHSGARAALAAAAASTARAAAALQANKLPTLEELRREEARTRLEARLLTGDKKMTPQKQAALLRIEERLHRIEADKRAVKAQAKQLAKRK